MKERWSFSAEGQIRSLAFYNDFHYYEYKAGAYYNLSEHFSAGILIGHYRTFSEGGTFELPLQTDELRTSVQVTMKQRVETIRFEHRYRVEQRFRSNGYKNRFRYRLAMTVPLKSKSAETSKWQFTIWNELFFTNTAPYFERDRFFSGIGYKVSPAIQLQLGYVHQFDYNLTDEIGRDFLQISFQYDFSDVTNAETTTGNE